jgi:hypothetical protein
VVHNFPISFVCLFNLPTSLVTAADTRSYLTIFKIIFGLVVENLTDMLY